MLPITLNPRMVRIGLAGAGDGLQRRRRLLSEAGVDPIRVNSESSDAALYCLSALFVAGLEAAAARDLARRARSGGVLVNVEDVPELCDFHVPAISRRGSLAIAVSTGGRVPGLAKRLRCWFDSRFGPEWDGRMEELSAARARWRADGLPAADVSGRTMDLIEKRGWLS